MAEFNLSAKRKSFFSGLSLSTQLIIINLFFYFVAFIILQVYGEKFILDYIAITPGLIIAGKSLWTFITSMFMHGSFFHIFANMFSLFFIGTFLERIIGRKRFFWVYIISGIIGGLFFVLAGLLLGDLNTPAVGASGAIFGLLGVLAVLVPFSRVYLIAGPLILLVLNFALSPILPPSLADAFSLVVSILIFVMIFSLLSFNRTLRKIAIPIELPMWLLPIIAIVPLTVIGYFVQLPIGNSAHIGGLIAGLAYGFYLRKKFPKKTKNLRNLFR